MAHQPELSYPLSAAYFLRFQGPLRVGTHPHDLGHATAFPASDTLFGALAWAAGARFGGQAFQAWLDQFVAGHPPVLWTSALPALLEPEGAFHVLLPLPVRRPGFPPDTEDRKLLRRVQYLHPALLPWFDGAASTPPHARLGPALLPADLAARVQRAAGPHTSPFLWQEAPRSQVALDRASGATSLFVSTSVVFGRFPPGTVEVGLAVCVLAQATTALTWLDGCFEVLAEAGIGGERSTGAGHFTWQRLDCPLPLSPQPSGPLLSLLWPRPAELAAGALTLPEHLGYRLVERTGWVGSPAWHGYRSRAVAMLGEGSYVAPSLPPPAGGLAVVTPLEEPGDPSRHPVYRYGYGCFLRDPLP